MLPPIFLKFALNKIVIIYGSDLRKPPSEREVDRRMPRRKEPAQLWSSQKIKPLSTKFASQKGSPSGRAVSVAD